MKAKWLGKVGSVQKDGAIGKDRKRPGLNGSKGCGARGNGQGRGSCDISFENTKN